MRLEVFKQVKILKLPSKKHISKLVSQVCGILGKQKGENLSVAFVGDKEIEKLNEHFLKRRGPTDILSFSGEGAFFGEIIINYCAVRSGAKASGFSMASIFNRLIVHGVLSLFGMDHHGAQAVTMLRVEERILKNLC